MNSSQNIFFLLLLSIVIGFCSCGKKYPEDNRRGLKSSKTRLEGASGEYMQWHIDKILINNEDVTSKYSDSLNPQSVSDFDFKIYFDVDPDGRTKYNLALINIDNPKPIKTNIEVAMWEFYINTKSMQCEFNSNTPYYKVKDPLSERKLSNLLFYSWKIEKLWKNDFHISTTKNSDSYDVYFKK